MPASTVPDSPPLGRLRRARLLRRTYLAATAAVVLVGLTGLTGPMTATATATGGGYALTVEYPQRSRAGLPAELRITVERDGGFDGPIALAIESGYLELFDDQGSMPQPASSTGDGEWIHLQFDPPPGDTLRVLHRLRVDTSAHRGREGAIAVLEDGAPVVSADLATGVLP